jgi:hypothetical protein
MNIITNNNHATESMQDFDVHDTSFFGGGLRRRMETIHAKGMHFDTSSWKALLNLMIELGNSICRLQR